MAKHKLMACTACGKDVSPKATTCPNCGNPIKKPGTMGTGKTLLLLLLGGIIFLIYLGSQTTKESVTPKRCTMKPNSYVAETKADLDLGTTLAVQKDEAAFAKLFADGRLRKSRLNTPVTQMSGGAFGAAKVRYTGETSVYWTDAEFILCK